MFPYNQQTLPYPQPTSTTFPSQVQKITRVNGENGARMYQMLPNSEVLLLDETAPIVWLVQTDGAGYKTITPYDVSPHQAEPSVDVKSLEDRIARLENRVNESYTKQNRNSQSRDTKN